MEAKKANIRMRSIMQGGDPTVVIGKRGEKVVAFEFSNHGTNSLATFKKDGVGYSLVPGQEKPFGLNQNVFFDNEEFIIEFSVIDSSSEHMHKMVLLEMYHKD